MNKKRRQRMLITVSLGFVLSIAVTLVLYALRQNISLYLTPQQVFQQHIPVGQEFRLGGLVKKDSVHHVGSALNIEFILTDFHKAIPVNYVGVLPSLFRPGQGIVAEGHMNSKGVFVADEVLAKHDADYHPPGISGDDS